MLLDQGEVGQLLGILLEIVEFLDFVLLESTDIFVATIVKGSVPRHFGHFAQFIQVRRYEVGVGAVFSARENRQDGTFLGLFGLLQRYWRPSRASLGAFFALCGRFRGHVGAPPRLLAHLRVHFDPLYALLVQF